MRLACCLLFATLPLFAGCATKSEMITRWVSNQGGLAASSAQMRTATVARQVIACCTGRDVSIQVLATNTVTAFCWPDGRLYFTRGLVDRLDDQELAAAVAHELGHLLSDGRMRTVASLRGCCVDPDREVRADAVGVELLRAQGLPPSAMVTMLKKVSNCGSLTPQCHLAMEHRIELISSRIRSQTNARASISP